jgi:threonine dehydrogenase-like Zn-dependent dehydrogenase
MSHVDGNAIGGLLTEVFGREVTDACGRCRECGTENYVGALHVYRAAGIVVRCPSCQAVLLRVVEAREQIWIELDGLLGSGLEPLRVAGVHVVHAGQVVHGSPEP